MASALKPITACVVHYENCQKPGDVRHRWPSRGPLEETGGIRHSWSPRGSLDKTLDIRHRWPTRGPLETGDVRHPWSPKGPLEETLDIRHRWPTRGSLEETSRSRPTSYRVNLHQDQVRQSWDERLATPVPHRYSSLKPNTAVEDVPLWTSVGYQKQDVAFKKYAKTCPVLGTSNQSIRFMGGRPQDTSLTANAEILDDPTWNVHLNAWVSSKLGQRNSYITIAEQRELIDRGIYHYMPEFLESPLLPCPRYVEHMQSRPVLKPIPKRRKTPRNPRFWKWKGRTEPVLPKCYQPKKAKEKPPPFFPPISPPHLISPSSPPPQSTSPPTVQAFIPDGSPPPPCPSPSKACESCDSSPDIILPRSPSPSESYKGPTTPAPSLVSEVSFQSTTCSSEAGSPNVLSEFDKNVNNPCTLEGLNSNLNELKTSAPTEQTDISENGTNGRLEGQDMILLSSHVSSNPSPPQTPQNSLHDPSPPALTGHMTPERVISPRKALPAIVGHTEGEHPYEDRPAESDSDYGSIRSGDNEKMSTVSSISGINMFSDTDSQLAPCLNEKPTIMLYHLEGRPKTASPMGWETTDKLIDSGQDEIGVSPSLLERLFFSNDYIEIMEVPTYGQVKYMNFDLTKDGTFLTRSDAAIIKKSVQIQPPDRLVVEDMVTLHSPHPPPIPVPTVPAPPPPRVESISPSVEVTPPPPTEPTPPPVKEPTPPPPVSKPKKRQIVKKKKVQPPPRAKAKVEETDITPSNGEPLVETAEPLSGTPEVDDPTECPSEGSPRISETKIESPEPEQVEQVPQDSELSVSTGNSIKAEDEPVVTSPEADSSSASPVQSSNPPTPPSDNTEDFLILDTRSPGSRSTEDEVNLTRVETPTPEEASPLLSGHPSPIPPEVAPPPAPEVASPLPQAVKDPEFRAEQERERLAEERRMKALDLFDRLKAKRFIPASVTADTTPRNGTEHKIQSYDGWLAQFFIVQEDKAKMYKQVFEVVDEDGDGYLSCFETLMALKGISGAHKLTEHEEAYIIRVLELAEYPVSQGTDLRLFSVLASLSQRIVSVDAWVRHLINSLDLTSLEWKITKAKELFEWCLQEDTKRLKIDRLLVELKAGGVSAEHQEEVRQTLGSKGSWDMIDFFLYLPLFIMTHKSVVDNPLDDSRVK